MSSYPVPRAFNHDHSDATRNGIAGAGRAGRTCARDGAPSLVVALLIALVFLATPPAARSGETLVTVEPLEPATSVWMLSAPHVGRRTCEVEAHARARFIARASHGPHAYAHVEVVEGACAGLRGFVPWSYIEPKPATDRSS